MNLVSNYQNTTPSPLKVWSELFDVNSGDDAVIFTGYLSAGTMPNAWGTKTVSAIVNWLRASPKDKDGKPLRTLTVIIGDWDGAQHRTNAVTFLTHMLSQLPVALRYQVTVHAVRGMHVKAYAMFKGSAGQSQCARLLTGSSNLTFSSMAAPSSLGYAQPQPGLIELDAYYAAPNDVQELMMRGVQLLQLKAKITAHNFPNQIPSNPISGEPVAAGIFSEIDTSSEFYDALESGVYGETERLALAAKKAAERDMAEASADCVTRNDEP